MDNFDEMILSGINEEIKKVDPSPDLWEQVHTAVNKRDIHSLPFWKISFVAIAVLTMLFAFPASRSFSLNLIRSITNVIDWYPPASGTVVKWETLPSVVQEVLLNGPVSPDKNWSAAIWTWHQIPTDVKLAIEDGKIPMDPKFLSGPQLWIADAHRQNARLIRTNLPGGYHNQMFLWSPWNTLLFYQPNEDSWHEINPSNGMDKTFLPEVLKGKMAGELRFSPDGTRLLYNTGIDHFTNKPSPRPQTTFIINVNGSDGKQIGVDVDARWQGDTLSAIPIEPEIIFVNKFPEGATWTLQKIDRIFAFIRAAASVQWRVYTIPPSPGDKPVNILTAKEDEPGVWVLHWPKTPAKQVYLELYAEVRRDVPDNPYFRYEKGKRWKVMGPFKATTRD
ncbi:MAG: hypothetical protein ACYC2T_08345 [Bacillota bacterium]